MKKIQQFILVLALCCVAAYSQASVVIAGTRVIFPAGEGQASVRLMNQNSRPALVQAWVDAGNPDATPDTVTAPFLVTPPVFRMNANQEQSLRILYLSQKKALPTDRESVFWLNVLEIPPKPSGKAAHQNTLQFAIRTRIKLFYRPANLSLSRAEAPSKLTWGLAQKQHKVTIIVSNPTAYYITLSEVGLHTAKGTVHAATGMVAPFSQLSLAVPSLSSLPSSMASVVFYSLSDFGTANKFQFELAQ